MDSKPAQWWAKAGIRFRDAQVNAALSSVGAQIGSGGGKPGPSFWELRRSRLVPVQHGYTQVTSNQPASRCWPFRWIEFGDLTVVALGRLTAVLRLLRRRRP